MLGTSLGWRLIEGNDDGRLLGFKEVDGVSRGSSDGPRLIVGRTEGQVLGVKLGTSLGLSLG